jgi:hypothetical protein
MKAQQADLITHNAVKDSIVEHFNKQEFAKVYALLSPDFKKQIAENQLITLLKNNIYEGIGKIDKSEYLGKKTNGENYKLTHEKSPLLLVLSVNEAKQIDGLAFKPFEQKRATKAASNNPLTTDLDKIVDSVARTYTQVKMVLG